MTGIYDELKAQDAAPPGAAPSIYDQLAEQDRREGELRASVQKATEITPETAAQRKYLSSVTGLPSAVVATAEGQAKALAKLRELQQASANSPVLRDRLANPDFAAIAQNDGPSLSLAETALRGFGEYVLRPIGGEGVGRFNQGAFSLLAAPFDLAAWALEPISGSKSNYPVLPANPARPVADFLHARAQAGAQWAKEYGLAAGDYGDFGRGVASGISSVWNSLLLAPLGIELQGEQALTQIGKAALPSLRALLPMGAQTAGQSYDEALQANLPGVQAALYAAQQGGVEMLTEALPFATYIRGLRGEDQFLKTLGKAMLEENVGEQVATHWQDLNEWLYLHPEKTLGDYIDERPDAALQTLIATTVATGIQSGVMHLAGSGARRRLEENQREIERTRADIANLQNLLSVAGGSQVRELDQATFAAFVQSAAERARAEGRDAPTSVWADGRVLADTLAQSGMTPEQIDAALPSLREQLADAQTMNRAVEIPIGELAAALPGSPLEQALLPNLRVREGGLSLNEAKEAQQQAQVLLQQEAERVIGQAADAAQAAVATETVRQKIKAELDAAGRFSSDVNDKGARLASQFYTVMAARLNTTPEKLYNDLLPYRVRGEGQGTFTQGDVQRFAEGLPMVKAGDTVDGRVVREDVPNMDSIRASLENPKVLPGIREIPLSAFDPQYLRSVTADSIDQRTRDLAEAIKASGEITPLIVAFDSQGPYIVEGGHRFDALIASGAKSLPAVVVLDQNQQGDQLNQSMTTQVSPLKGVETDPNAIRVPGLEEASQPGGEEQLAHNVELFGKNVQTVAGEEKRGYDSIIVPTDGTPLEKAEAVINQMVRNLRTIYNAIPESIRQRSKLWYDGANRIASAFAHRYQLTLMQSAAQLAVTSPQADWRMNVSYVERINDILTTKQNHQWDEAMTRWADDWIAASEAGRQAEAAKRADAVRNAERELRAAQRAIVREQEKLERNTPKLQERIDQAEAALAQANAELKDAKKNGTPAAVKRAETKVAKANDTAKAARNTLRAAQREVGKAQTVARKAEKDLNEKRERAAEPDANLAVQELVRGKKLSELTTDFERAWFVRAYDEAYNPRHYRDVTPEGGFLDFVRTGAGAEDSLGWKSFSPIAKAISIFYDGSDANIHAQLGGEHKVRNFYNNIFAPNSPHPFVTSDTHQVAANLFLPLGADALEVAQNFGGTGTRAFSERGLNGTYWLYSEAVKRAAEAEGVLPREMQSISWEAIRSLFEPSFKADPNKVNAVRDLWVQYQRGDATYDDTIRAIIALAGDGANGFRPPSWVGTRPDSAAAPEAGNASYESGLAHARQGLAERGELGSGDEVVSGSQFPGEGQPRDQLNQSARDGSGRDSGGGVAPLPGAPVVEGATGPDQRLVAVAEQYARDHGISLKRQSSYATVDPERAARIAAAYAAMEHAPQDPQVKAAYQNLIEQTIVQYRALEAAGYQFYFFDDTNDPYAGNPWNAMRDLRANQVMGVYASEAGFGSGATDINVEDNPLLADTGITWPYGSLDGKPKRVLANDLFRAVHDAFGHGLEGAGFRAQGEENAWQAHARLFTGSALAALTSETRGQNSWLNYGPHGEANRNAAVEDTVFADQKTGLMPEWTWTEGRTEDMPDALEQSARGTYDIASMTTVLNGTADLSTFLHETGHFFLDALRRMVASGQATPEVVAMHQAALKALGVSEENWNAWHADYEATGKIADGLRAAHEKWAETFEAYLFTGQAPSVEVRSLFRTFAAWLKRVYQSIEAFAAKTGTTLDPDLKAVMDRMLATDEQIAEAELAAGLTPNLDATAEAQEKLNARSLRDLKWAINARNRYIAQLQKQAASLRKAIAAEVRAEVEQQPVYRAEMLLRYGRLPEAEQNNAQRKAMDQMAGMTIKLGLPQLKEMYGDGPAAPWRYLATGKNGLAASEGVHPDVLADALGFPSGDALVRALLGAEPIASVVEGMTDQRMLERHGDLATPEAIAQAATEAVHNEARARSLATELAGQRDMLSVRRDTGEVNAKGQRVTVNVLMEAAKNFATTVIGRQKLGNLKKAIWAHLQAERRAGKAWEQATARGDSKAAVQAKQDQVLNNAAVRAGQEAQRELQKAMELFKRVTRGTDEKLVERGYDPDIANAARAILAAYGIAPAKGKSAVEYLETLQKADPQTYAAVAPSVSAALLNAKPFDELTVDELLALTDEVESLWHLARRSRQMEIDGKLLDREHVQEELQGELEARGIPDVMPGDISAITPAEQAMRKLQAFRAAATRAENWAQNLGALFTRYVFQPVKEAADRYRVDKTVYLKKYRALLDAIAPSLRRELIEAPELGYTFGRDTGGIAMQEVLHAILHTGNASNKKKLLLGRGWATEREDGTLDTSRWDAFLARMIAEGRITKAHYDFAQGVWDLLEEMKPLAQKTHRDVFGRYFAEVTADAFTTPFGSYRGGYVPAIADGRIVSDKATRDLAEAENESMAFAFPATNRGFTKGRVEYNRPLLLDLRTLAQHIDKVLLFSHLEQPVRDVRRVLTSKTVSYGLNRIDPAGFDNVVTPWLNRAARQSVETPVAGDAGLMRLLSGARSRVGMGAMFANIANAAQQLTGFSLAAVKVRPGLLLEATAQMTAHPRDTKAAVAAASIYMRERMENEASNAEAAIREILLNPSLYERGQAWSAKHAYFLQQAVDNAMGPIIWTAAYNQAVEKGASTKDAVRFADSVIRTTQGSTLPEDVSRLEGGNAFVRLFTQFSSYFNMQANLLGTEFAQVARELGVKKGAGKMFYVTLLGFLAPAWVAEAIMQAFRGGPDDEDKDGQYLDDWLAAVFGWSTLRGATAMVPAVGPVINAAVNKMNSKPYDDRIQTSPVIGSIESAVGAPASVYKAIVENGSRQKAVRDVAALITLATGLPAGAVARPLGYAAGMSDFRVAPTGPVDAARGMMTGYASPPSRTQ